jgi:biotin operon repressor
MVLLMKRRYWRSQADLARDLGLTTESVRTLLGELVDAGITLESKREHPNVYWRVPKTWYPGAILVEKDNVGELLRLLTRLPKTQGRDRLLDLVVSQLPAQGALRQSPPPIRSRSTSEHEEEYLTVVERAAQSHAALQMRTPTAPSPRLSPPSWSSQRACRRCRRSTSAWGQPMGAMGRTMLRHDLA